MEQLELKMKKRRFPVNGPLDESDLSVYDKAVRYFRCGPTYQGCKSVPVREALEVDFGLYMVELHQKYHKNGREW